MIRCIIFDLGDVIVHNHPERACRRISKTCPHNSHATSEVEWFAPAGFHRLIDTGRITKTRLYREAVKSLGIKLSQKKFEQYYADIFTSNVPVQRLARRLSKNYRLVLLSNTNAIHFEFIKKNFPIIKVFDRIIVSYKAGATKPSQKIYRQAIRKSGCSPSECVFIDNELRNVRGARKAGLHAIHYTTPARLRKDLKKLGVKL